MVLNRTMGIVRLGLGFLIAPAILPVFGGTLIVTTGGADVDCPVLLPNFLRGIVALSYACAVVFGLPCVLDAPERRTESLDHPGPDSGVGPALARAAVGGHLDDVVERWRDDGSFFAGSYPGDALFLHYCRMETCWSARFEVRPRDNLHVIQDLIEIKMRH